MTRTEYNDETHSGRLTPARKSIIEEWRRALHLRIRQHHFARTAIEDALAQSNPLEALLSSLPEDRKSILTLENDVDLQRAALARYTILSTLSENPDWRSKVFAEALCVSAERIRQLRKVPPQTLADLGIAEGRPAKIKVPVWVPRKTPRKIQKKWQTGKEASAPNQRELIKQLALAMAADNGENGVNTYLVNMALGNSDLPSRNVEWRIVELSRMKLLECRSWSDGRRKNYVLSAAAQEWIKAQGIRAQGTTDFAKWLDGLPRQKRESGLPPAGPTVTISQGAGKAVTARQWVGLKEPPSTTGGRDLAQSHSTINPQWANDPSSLVPTWADTENESVGKPWIEAIERDEIVERPDQAELAQVVHAIRIHIHRLLHSEASKKNMTMANLARRLAEIMQGQNKSYPSSRPEAIAKLGTIPTIEEAEHLESILDTGANSIARYPRHAPWAVSKMRRRP